MVPRRCDPHTGGPPFACFACRMSSFQWVTVVYGMLIGLTVTRLMSGFACALRSRHVARPCWVSLIWAAVVFLSAMDCWWSLQGVRTYQHWTYPVFLMTMMEPLLLFFAAVMILPFAELKAGDDPSAIYYQHGRWALLALALYNFEGMASQILFWGERPNLWGYIGCSGFLLLFFLGPSRRVARLAPWPPQH